jgi:hypothetical protein
MPSTRTLTVTTFSLFAGLAASSLTLAHHGAVTQPSLYLTDNFVELQGEIVDVLWRNPHTRAHMRVVDDNGEEQLWEIEISPGPHTLEQLGINEEDLFGPARAAGYISRRDTDSLGALHVLLPDGREYAQGNRELLWAGDRVANTQFAIDPERAAEEQRTATSIFRTWGRRVGPRPQADEYHHLLTERGREAAAQFYAPRDNPELECRTGLGASMMDPMPFEIIDEGDRILVHQAEYNVHRTIWLDPEASGVESAPTPFGFSVGRWEDDVLIVHTTHIDFPYLDPYGTPQSDQIEYLERFGISESDGEPMLDYSLTATDPVMYAEPIVFERPRRWSPGRVFEEFNCTHEWEGGSE